MNDADDTTLHTLADEVGCQIEDQDGFDCGADDYKGPTDDTPWNEGERCCVCATFALVARLEADLATMTEDRDDERGEAHCWQDRCCRERDWHKRTKAKVTQLTAERPYKPRTMLEAFRRLDRRVRCLVAHVVRASLGDCSAGGRCHWHETTVPGKLNRETQCRKCHRRWTP